MPVNTTWTDPSTGGTIDLATNDVLTETIYDKILSNLKHLGGTVGTEWARVYDSNGVVIPSGAWTSLTYNNERWDTNALHDTGSNTSRLTCRTAGVHLIAGSVQIDSAAASSRGLRIRLGGSTVIAARFASAANTSITMMSIATLYFLSVNDYVELQAYQDSGSSINASFQANFGPEFMMINLGAG